MTIQLLLNYQSADDQTIEQNLLDKRGCKSIEGEVFR